MKDFSIELSAEQVVDPRSKEYFSEVLSSFINGHYRSSAVMLWSVVIADLVYKLQELRDLYQDAAAILILDSIEAKQKIAPTNPEWEPYLIDEINNRTQFFEAGEYLHIQNIHKLRHLSAHPVLSSANLLFQPNKETTRAAIRNALECVLLKSPVFSKKVVISLIKDLTLRKEFLPDDASLKKYLEAKYLRNLHATVKLELIKTLWKFCFRLTNAEADTNRQINVRTLSVLHNRDPIDFIGMVRQQAEHFSEVAAGGAPLVALVAFLVKCPKIYTELTDAAKVPIAAFARSNVNYFAAAIFVSLGVKEHLQELTQLNATQLAELSDASWNFLLSACREAGVEQDAFSIAIKIYTTSGGFNTADSNFARFVSPYVQELDQARITELLSGIEKNNQTYWRGRARTDHQAIKERVDAISGIDLAPYKNFRESLPNA